MKVKYVLTLEKYNEETELNNFVLQPDDTIKIDCTIPNNLSSQAYHDYGIDIEKVSINQMIDELKYRLESKSK